MPRLQIVCPRTSDTGAFRLSWDGPAGATYQLHETGPGDHFQLVYHGQQLATTVSGRLTGIYTYRLETENSASATCVVEVAPPSMALALSLFGLGSLVCLATVVTIVVGHRAHRRGELG